MKPISRSILPRSSRYAGVGKRTVPAGPFELAAEAFDETDSALGHGGGQPGFRDGEADDAAGSFVGIVNGHGVTEAG